MAMTVTDVYETMNNKAGAFFEWLKAHPEYGLPLGVGLLVLWHGREHSPLNGRMLLLFCWLFAILIPLGIPLLFCLFNWMIAFTTAMILCFLPALFCQLRYTAERREALREHYGKMKHPGRKLAQIVLVAIALTAANVALMFHFGFIYSTG